MESKASKATALSMGAHTAACQERRRQELQREEESLEVVFPPFYLFLFRMTFYFIENFRDDFKVEL